ncbi:MAG: toxin-antitoxin system YwqK family antitoxin [Kordia sp.]|uniref:toxin-antitoxin system YwqK family antitoxin n=1 Tax=Kordia sp. TaxID=1965332 RepID=UPI00385FD3B5
MKKVIVLMYLVSFINCAQNEKTELPTASEMVSMNDATVKYGTPNGQQYFAKGSTKPYTGWLCARYDNGELESAQQFINGYGNGIWINFDPDGRKESQGTYKNNKTEGPSKLFYEDGSVKAEGNFVHVKKKVGWWTFYDRKGNVVSKRFFTR